MEKNSQSSSAFKVIFKSLVFIALPIVVIVALAFAIPRYYYDVTDWLALRSYSPSQEIKSLAADAQLSNEGKQIFYVHDPKVREKEEFNADCPFKERSYVLGCYDGRNIYILEIHEQRLEKTESVTAAHETLHAAYQRLKPEEKNRIDSLLNEALENADQRVIDLVEEYRKADKQAVPSELHSIIGTEVKNLAPELEEYYSQYFTNRQKVVTNFDDYEKVFSGLKSKADNLQAEIDDLKAEKNKIEKQLNSQQAKINSLDSKLNQLEKQNEIEEYNALVPERNNLANSYNANITQLKTVVDSHNQKVKQKNSIATEINDLLFSINSKQYEKI